MGNMLGAREQRPTHYPPVDRVVLSGPFRRVINNIIGVIQLSSLRISVVVPLPEWAVCPSRIRFALIFSDLNAHDPTTSAACCTLHSVAFERYDSVKMVRTPRSSTQSTEIAAAAAARSSDRRRDSLVSERELTLMSAYSHE
jgi:hypothetical protein